MSEKIAQLNEEAIKGRSKELVRGWYMLLAATQATRLTSGYAGCPNVAAGIYIQYAEAGMGKNIRN